MARPPFPSLTHTLWLRDHSSAFVYFPKVACTSWKLFFAYLLGLESPGAYADIHQRCHLPLPYVAEMSAEDQDAFSSGLIAGEIQLCAVVREPRERLLSAYLDKIKYHTKADSFFSLEVHPAIRTHAAIADDSIPSLEQFLSWIASTDNPQRLNDHWLPMSQLLGWPFQSPKLCYQLWTMKDIYGASAFFNVLFGSSIAFPRNDALGPRPSWNSRSALSQYWSPGAEELFQQVYRTDINLYEFTEHR